MVPPWIDTGRNRLALGATPIRRYAGFTPFSNNQALGIINTEVENPSFTATFSRAGFAFTLTGGINDMDGNVVETAPYVVLDPTNADNALEFDKNNDATYVGLALKIVNFSGQGDCADPANVTVRWRSGQSNTLDNITDWMAIGTNSPRFDIYGPQQIGAPLGAFTLDFYLSDLNEYPNNVVYAGGRVYAYRSPNPT